MKKENFPDKRWLILAISTLSQGKDEIFASDYMPSKPLAKVVQEQLDQPMFENIPLHLQAKGRGRALRFNGLTKEQRLQQKLAEAEQRIAKQQDAKKRISDQIGVMQSKDQEQIKWMQERERIRAEVHAELQQQANTFVQEQIQMAHTQMYAEIERRVAEHSGHPQLQSQLEEMEFSQSQNRSQMRQSQASDRSVDLNNDMFAPLKEITEKMRQSTISKSRINPIVMSNGEILSG